MDLPPVLTAAGGPAIWVPSRTPIPDPWPVPSKGIAIRRGLACHCPACGAPRLFDGYLRVIPECPACGAPLGLARADDAPPYFTILIVGHIVITGMLLLERTVHPALWVHAAIWLPLTLGLSLGLLRPIKGATVGLMLALGILKSAGE